MSMEILKVSATSNSTATAGALANTIREIGEAELQGIGPKAINQAVKAIAIARSYLASSGLDLVAVPSFVDVEIDGAPRTALRFSVKPRHLLREEGLHEEEIPRAAPEPEEPLREAPSLSEAIAGRPRGVGLADEEEGDDESIPETPPLEESSESDLDEERDIL